MSKEDQELKKEVRVNVTMIDDTTISRIDLLICSIVPWVTLAKETWTKQIKKFRSEPGKTYEY